MGLRGKWRLSERALLKTSALSCLCKLKSALRIKVSAYAIWFCDEYSIIYHLNGSDQPHFAIFFFSLERLAKSGAMLKRDHNQFL